MPRWIRADTIFATFAILATFFYPLPADDLSPRSVESLRVLDRNGLLLRELLSDRSGRGRWIPLDSLSPRLVHAAIIAEDKRFYRHRGVDPVATVRALVQNLKAGKTISGASTITQQVIRNLYHPPRNIATKLVEMWMAVRLEHSLSKNEILEQYLNRIPFGNLTFGAEAASQLYFGKSARELTWAEAAYLVALPKSPTAYNPYVDRSRAEKRQQVILHKLMEAGTLPYDEGQRALAEPLVLFPKSSAFYAPHFVEWVTRNDERRGDVRTTLDLPLQVEIEKIIRAEVNRHAGNDVTNAAVLVVENETGHILAYCGSADFFDERHDGQFDAVLARRQPGSTLKPFTYALAFQKGFTPASIIADVETNIPSEKGTFTPRNYDNRFHGPVRVRQALACSYNVPAVRVLQDVGVGDLLSLLQRVGFESLSESPSYYGHGLTLGNGEVTLFELTRAYRTLANRGRFSELSPFPVDTVPSRPALDERIVFLITDILSDAVARLPAFGYDSPIALPFPCASKTGTSSDYRDNWTVGYTRELTVGVWVGNFDNSPMREISGVTGAGPIFRATMERLYRDRVPPAFVPPHGVIRKIICGASGEIPHQGCPFRMEEFFLPSAVPGRACIVHDEIGRTNWAAISPLFQSSWNVVSAASKPIEKRKTDVTAPMIVFPADRSVFRIDPSVRRDVQAVTFQAIVPQGIHRIEWILNGTLYGTAEAPFRTRWLLEPGKFVLRARSVSDPSTVSEEIQFEVIP
jgi:penicillin-binding protein 1C